jgi:hypothetical protein
LRAYLFAAKWAIGEFYEVDGSVLAQSDAIEASSLLLDYSLISFSFPSSQQYQMLAAHRYAVLVLRLESTVSSAIVGADVSSPTHSLNGVMHSEGVWQVITDHDVIFYVYGFPPSPAISSALPFVWGAITIWSIGFIVVIGAAFISGIQSLDFSGILSAVVLSIGILIALLVTLAITSGFLLL